jgi:integrase
MAITKYSTKKGLRYKVELYQAGVQVARKAGFATKREAKQWLAKATRAADTKQLQTIRMGCASLATKYLSFIEPRKKRTTYINKRSVIRRFLSFLRNPDMPTSEITRGIISEYHQGCLERGPKAANRDLKEISIWMNWAIKEGYLRTNPARGIEPFAEKSYTRYIPPAEDLAAVRIAATREERDIIDCIYYTAGRFSEILALAWEDVNLEAGAIRLWTSKRKSGNKQPRVLAIHPELRAILERRQSNGTKWVFPCPNKPSVHYARHHKFIVSLFKNVCTRADVKPFTAHSIRHYIASAMADSRKATSRQIQNFLGHMNIRTTEIYLHDLRMDTDILTAFPDENSMRDSMRETQEK